MSSSEVHMHFYPHNIGQFAADTSGMSLSHVGALIRLIDRYAQTEKPIKTEWVNLAFRGEELGFAKDVLSAMFSQTEDGFIYDPLTETIADYQKSAEARRENGKKGGRPRKKNLNVTEQVSLGFQNGGCEKPNCNRVGLQPITNNQEPITNNQEVEVEEAASATLCDLDFLPPENKKPAFGCTTEHRLDWDADNIDEKHRRQALRLYPFTDEELQVEYAKFVSYFTTGKGREEKEVDGGWTQRWLNWLGRAIPQLRCDRKRVERGEQQLNGRPEIMTQEQGKQMMREYYDSHPDKKAKLSAKDMEELYGVAN